MDKVKTGAQRATEKQLSKRVSPEIIRRYAPEPHMVVAGNYKFSCEEFSNLLT